MSHDRQRRRIAKRRRHATPHGIHGERKVVIHEAVYVERLAYTRAQAAEALGISRSTFIRRVLPHVETIEMPWGACLIPVDELERHVAERRRAASAPIKAATPGRPPTISPEVIERIQAERVAGKSLRRIAAGLNADGTPTAHGGQNWWPSTVRAVLRRGLAPITTLPRGSGETSAGFQSATEENEPSGYESEYKPRHTPQAELFANAVGSNCAHRADYDGRYPAEDEELRSARASSVSHSTNQAVGRRIDPRNRGPAKAGPGH